MIQIHISKHQYLFSCTSSFKYLKKTNHVKRITENEKLIATHIEKMAPIPVKMTSPTVDMNKTLQASPSAKKIGSVSKERDNMQVHLKVTTHRETL